MPRIDLSGKPICITGASSGIGRAAAIECARAGMPVVVNARRADRLDELVEQITALGGRAASVAGDVADPEVGHRVVEKSFEAFGGIYAVFANAGYGIESAIHEMTDEQLRDIFETNFFGTMNTIRPAIPHLQEQGAGHLVICSSCVSKFALPYYGAYSATKAAQNHIGRAMRLELEPQGVHVSTVHPVGTKTEFFDQTKQRSRRSALVEHSPDIFMQSPERVARAVIRCLRKPRPEVWTSQLVRFGMAFSMAIPRLSDSFIRAHVKKRLELDRLEERERARRLAQRSEEDVEAALSDPR